MLPDLLEDLQNWFLQGILFLQTTWINTDLENPWFPGKLQVFEVCMITISPLRKIEKDKENRSVLRIRPDPNIFA